MVGLRRIQEYHPASIKIMSPMALTRSLWRNVWCWCWKFGCWRFCRCSAFYAIIQTHISSWYWDGTVSWRIIIILEKWQWCISGTNIPWYIIHPFWTLSFSDIYHWRTSFFFQKWCLGFINTNVIQKQGRIYQFAILSKLFLNIAINIVFKTLIENIISDKFVFSITQNYPKQIIKRGDILERYYIR